MHILNALLFGFLLGQHFVINPQRIVIAYNRFKDAFDIDAIFGGCSALIFVIDAQVQSTYVV